CLTVTGKPIAENLTNVPDLDFDAQKIIYPLENPLKATGHLQILYGNLAEGGSVAKISGKEGERFEGTARVFNGEFELIAGIQNGKVKAGDRKSTRLNSSHVSISYAVFCLKKKKKT